MSEKNRLIRSSGEYLKNRRASHYLSERERTPVSGTSGKRSRSPRIALYSHDTMGLGHFRRNMLIAQTFASTRFLPSILMISGIFESNYFQLPPGVDCIALPSLYKNSQGLYTSRRMHVSLQELITIRRQVILTIVRNFRPDIFIVDSVPWGVLEELDLTLEHLNATGDVRCILGLRDILDEPSVTQKEWNQRANFEAVRKYYDEIWVYGDSTLFDIVDEYRLDPDIGSKVRYLGYLGTRLPADEHVKRGCTGDEKVRRKEQQFVLCMVGGGQDGIRLAETFASVKLPRALSGKLIRGPHMSARNCRRLKRYADSGQIEILDFVNHPNTLIRDACCIVSMGGYNSVCEIISSGKKALIVPRVEPRKEQYIRAQRMQSRNLIDMVRPDELVPDMLREWILNNMSGSNGNAGRHSIDMNGLSKLSRILEEIVSEDVPALSKKSNNVCREVK